MPTSQGPTRLEQTSSVLGEYMLKGWTLTDLHCDQCRITPLMREPASTATREGRDPIQFCALCDGPPGSSQAQQPLSHAQSSSLPSTSATSMPTQDISVLGSRNPAIAKETGGPVINSHDDAAEKISGLLLQGYSLLGTNCPNASCRGIPLVGYPKRDGKKDGRRLCVGCGSRWVDEGDMKGLKLVAAPFTSTEGGVGKGKGKSKADQHEMVIQESEEPESPRTRRRNELYGLRTAQAPPTASTQAAQSGAQDLDSDDEIDEIMERVKLKETGQKQKSDRSAEIQSALAPALQKTSSSLAATLDRLATSLERHTVGTDKDAEARYFVDVKLHMDAMKDVLSVMEMVERAKR